jgi:DNA-binding transcriptional regulator GbsR (MarR family)
MSQLTQNEARSILRDYKQELDELTASRIGRILAALDAGLTKTEIAELLGLSRPHLQVILREMDKARDQEVSPDTQSRALRSIVTSGGSS